MKITTVYQLGWTDHRWHPFTSLGSCETAEEAEELRERARQLAKYFNPVTRRSVRENRMSVKKRTTISTGWVDLGSPELVVREQPVTRGPDVTDLEVWG